MKGSREGVAIAFPRLFTHESNDPSRKDGSVVWENDSHRDLGDSLFSSLPRATNFRLSSHDSSLLHPG